MFSVYQQLVAWMATGRVSLFVVYFGIAWALWLITYLPSFRYRPARAIYRASVSVGIAMYSGLNQDPLRIAAVLESITAQMQPGDDVIVALNGPENPALREAVLAFDVRLIETRIGSKRNALVLAADAAQNDIVIYADDDTIWLPGARDELLRPFADEQVGGVTSHQTIERPFRSLAYTIAAWLELVRFNSAARSQSVNGHVLVLPGRTVAYRRSILTANRESLLHDTIFGFHAEWSDDTNLTWAARKMGYKTVYQSTARVTSTAQPSLRALAKQQVRWSRGGRLYMLKNLWWAIWNSPSVVPYILGAMLMPFFTVSLVISVVGSILRSPVAALPTLQTATVLGAALGTAIAGAVAATLVRSYRTLIEQPSAALMVPLAATVGMVGLTAIHIYGLAVCALPGSWATHAGAGVTKRHIRPKQLIPTATAVVLLTAAVLTGLLFVR